MVLENRHISVRRTSIRMKRKLTDNGFRMMNKIDGIVVNGETIFLAMSSEQLQNSVNESCLEAGLEIKFLTLRYWRDSQG